VGKSTAKKETPRSVIKLERGGKPPKRGEQSKLGGYWEISHADVWKDDDTEK